MLKKLIGILIDVSLSDSLDDTSAQSEPIKTLLYLESRVPSMVASFQSESSGGLRFTNPVLSGESFNRVKDRAEVSGSYSFSLTSYSNEFIF